MVHVANGGMLSNLRCALLLLLVLAQDRLGSQSQSVKRTWWTDGPNAGKCGRHAPLYNGYYAHCDPNDPQSSCCSFAGFCGSTSNHCNCVGCVNYTADPGAFTRPPVKPSLPILWHVGEFRYKCGDNAPYINDNPSICNPDDDHRHCCSAEGECGAGASYCDCIGCVDCRLLPPPTEGSNSSTEDYTVIPPAQYNGSDPINAPSPEKPTPEAPPSSVPYLYQFIIAVPSTLLIISLALCLYAKLPRGASFLKATRFFSEVDAKEGKRFEAMSAECGDLRAYDGLSRLIKPAMTSDYICKRSELMGREQTTSHLFDEESMSKLNDVRIDRRRLQLGHVIGQGQYGCVYKGYLRGPDGGGAGEPSPVAVKTLKSNSDSAKEQKNLLNEGLVMRGFKHKNVLTLIGVAFEPNGSPLVVTPFMLYGDLRSFIRADLKPPSVPSLTIRELIEFGIQIAQGMAYLSSCKFIHRDLAARNCMLDEHKIVRVADFGLSRDIYAGDYQSKSDKDCKLPIWWMAPESLQDCIYSTKSDIWSFGVVLWELMTGCMAQLYKGIDSHYIFVHLSRGHRLPRPPSCPKSLYEIMQACWRADPSERPGFDELVVGVSSVITQHSVPRNLDYVDYPVDG